MRLFHKYIVIPHLRKIFNAQRSFLHSLPTPPPRIRDRTFAARELVQLGTLGCKGCPC
jgi:hypothetical protein